MRATEIDLRSKGLNGALPANIGSLSKLRALRLGGNSLSGAIPSEIGGLSKPETLGLANNGLSGDVPESLGGLSKLTWLRLLTGNSLSGCVPRALRGVDDSDLSSSTLPFCNNAPQFSSESYSFAIAENAAVGSAVGTASATDADGDSITYSISAGNGGGEFAIDAASGAITLAAALDYEKTTSYALTVTANDGNHAGTDTASATVSVTDVLDTPPSAPTGLSASHSSGTFTASWSAVEGANLYRVGYRIAGAGDEWMNLPTLSWDKPADDLITGYRLTRRAQGSDEVATIEIKGRAATIYADSGLSANTKYIYRVHAIDYFKRVGAATRTTATTGAAGG